MDKSKMPIFWPTL